MGSASIYLVRITPAGGAHLLDLEDRVFTVCGLRAPSVGWWSTKTVGTVRHLTCSDCRERVRALRAGKDPVSDQEREARSRQQRAIQRLLGSRGYASGDAAGLISRKSSVRLRGPQPAGAAR